MKPEMLRKKPLDHVISETEKMTAKRAREVGSKIYFSSECHKGHIGWRRTSSNTCIACQRQSNAKLKRKAQLAKEGKSSMVKIDRLRDSLSLKNEVDDYYGD